MFHLLFLDVRGTETAAAFKFLLGGSCKGTLDIPEHADSQTLSKRGWSALSDNQTVKMSNACSMAEVKFGPVVQYYYGSKAKPLYCNTLPHMSYCLQA